MKALVVTYCARGDRSRTAQLVEHATGVLKARKAATEILNIAEDIPDLFTPDRLAAYYERDYGGQKLSAEKVALMKNMDRMTAQLMKADIVVLGYPMYNFSQPAIVKAWIDSVMLKGKTWDFGPKGYLSLMKGRKALVISTSGGVYEGEMAAWEHSASLSKTDFAFMGYEAEAVVASGMNMFPEKEAALLAEAKKKIAAILERWLA